MKHSIRQDDAFRGQRNINSRKHSESRPHDLQRSYDKDYLLVSKTSENDYSPEQILIDQVEVTYKNIFLYSNASIISIWTLFNIFNNQNIDFTFRSMIFQPVIMRSLPCLIMKMKKNQIHTEDLGWPIKGIIQMVSVYDFWTRVYQSNNTEYETNLSKFHHIYFSCLDVVVLVLWGVSPSILVVTRIKLVFGRIEYKRMLPVHHQISCKAGDNFKSAKINLLYLITY